MNVFKFAVDVSHTNSPIRGGNWNGYVAVPPSHPWYGINYYKDEIEGVVIHGGLTYSGNASEFYSAIEHEILIPIDADSVPDGFEDMWVFGFDCQHLNDTPENWPWERLVDEVNHLADQIMEVVK